MNFQEHLKLSKGSPLVACICVPDGVFSGISGLFETDRYGHEYRFQHEDDSDEANAPDEPAPQEDRKRGQGEYILVLEDDPDVRAFVVTALEALGYRVHEAADAAAALKVLEEEAGNLDLLLSDVVLPGGVSGPELAAKAKELYPELKLVFMSGYAADLYIEDKIPGFDETLLNKPFKVAELAEAIKDALDD